MVTKPTKWTPQARGKFLAEIKRSGNVSVAARRVGISRSYAYEWREADVDFAQAWDDAKEEYIDTLEAEADRRALEGITKNIYFDKDGNVLGEVRTFSDSLMMFRLKGERPDKYREPPHGIDPKVVQIFLQQVLVHLDESAKQDILTWIQRQPGLAVPRVGGTERSGAGNGHVVGRGEPDASRGS